MRQLEIEKKSITLQQTKKNYFSFSILIYILIFSILLIKYGHELWGGIAALTLVLIVSLCISKLDLLHPYTWFVPSFYLYSISIPLLVAVGDIPYIPNLRKTMFLEWISLVVFLIIVGLPLKSTIKLESKLLLNINHIVWPIYVGSLILTLLNLMYVYFSGLSSKYEISLNNSIFSGFSAFFSIVILTFILIVAKNLIFAGKIPIKFILFNLLYSILVLVILGERDIILRVIIGVLFLIHVLYKPFSKITLLIVGTVVLISIPIMFKMKNLLISSKGLIVTDGSFLQQFFGSEFISASRNLQLLVDNSNRWTYFYGETFLWDIKRAFFKGTDSATLWFHQVFFPGMVERGAGNGFTIVGEGYINFGILGVLLVFSLIAYFLKFLYIQSQKNIIWLVIYITIIPIMVYLIRADFATLFAQFTKHIAIPLILIFVIKEIVNKVKK